MTSKKKAAIITAIILAAVIIAAAAVLYINDPLRFALFDRISHIGDSAELKERSVETLEISDEDFKADPRVTFDQSMMLINTDFLLPEGFSADIAEYKDTGVYLNSCANSAFAELSAEVISRFDQILYVSSSYRTAEEQAEEIAEGGDLAQKVGASEHQAGLALDVYVRYFAGEGFIKSEAGKWVNRSCGDYGFIIRYPLFGKNETGIDYEPWHIRYVGLPHSEIIMKNSMTLEGYLSSLENGKFYSYRSGGKKWLISRQSKGVLNVPEKFESAVISEDNTGGYVITFEV